MDGDGMGIVRRMWEETVGMDLSHLSDEELVEFGMRQCMVETPEDLASYEARLREAEVEAEYREEWRQRLAGHLGMSRDTLEKAIARTEKELGDEALERLRRELGDPPPGATE